ncbi:MAG: MBL fold metallo-hydrolase [Chthoniobacteraceae bacterium]
MQIDTYTGGAFETNSYFLPTQEGGVLIDAAEGVCDWLQSRGQRVSTLLITHGHFDHVPDAALLKKTFNCQVGYHRDGIAMLTERHFFRRLGIPYDIEPIAADFYVDETLSLTVDDLDFAVQHVPGHCPGSLCFLLKSERQLFCGDVLFAGGIGRWDLPGGDRSLLIDGITGKLLTLGDDVRVFPGHGPSTTIGRERASNPFLTRP